MRDELGAARWCGRMLVEGNCELDIIELMVILRDIQLVSNMGIQKLMVERNCLLMIQQCASAGNAHPSSKVEVLAKKIMELSKTFNKCRFACAYRELNKPMHLLARFS